MTFGFAQSPAAVSDLALPQFLSPVLPARNTLLGPAYIVQIALVWSNVGQLR